MSWYLEVGIRVGNLWYYLALYILNYWELLYHNPRDENRKQLTAHHLQPTVGPDGKKKEPESNVLLASIENMQYAVTVDVIHTVTILFPR